MAIEVESYVYISRKKKLVQSNLEVTNKMFDSYDKGENCQKIEESFPIQVWINNENKETKTKNET